MTCQEFRDLWNARLDARSAGLPETIAALDAHSDSCASCHALSAGFHAIAQVEWPRPIASPDLSAKILASLNAELAPGRNVISFRAIVLWGTAAAAGLLGFVVLRSFVVEDKQHLAERLPNPRPPFAVAFANATSASIDLAREATEPAARVSRHVLDDAPRPDPSWADRPEARPAGEILQSVGKRVEEEVRPFSISAKRAFGFLLGPSPPHSGG